MSTGKRSEHTLANRGLGELILFQFFLTVRESQARIGIFSFFPIAHRKAEEREGSRCKLGAVPEHVIFFWVSRLSFSFSR